MKEEKRSGKDRRVDHERRHAKKSLWIMAISLLEKRGGMDRRSGLDRRTSVSADFRKEGLIEITQKGMIRRWDPVKAKMTYLWDSGLKAIAFADFKKGSAVEVLLNTHQGRIALPGHVLRIQKVFTEHGFATEMDVQFEALDDYKRALINQILWGD